MGLVALALAGCTQQELQGFLPGDPDTTNNTSRIMGLWTTSWIVLLAVGIITWVLIIWASIAYRRRKNDTGIPAQMRYNMPIEMFFTIVPLILVVGFFAFTIKDQNAVEARFDEPDVKIEVMAKRWSWDFNYLNAQGEGDVYSEGVQVQPDPEATQGELDESTIPVLYLPVGKKVEIALESRDVIHSFWVVDFLYKKDTVPGKTNYMSVIPEREGEYIGKCAELCGEYHSMMLFKVKVVSEAEYEAYKESLAEKGNVGRLGSEYDPNQNLPGTKVPEPVEH